MKIILSISFCLFALLFISVSSDADTVIKVKGDCGKHAQHCRTYIDGLPQPWKSSFVIDKDELGKLTVMSWGKSITPDEDKDVYVITGCEDIKLLDNKIYTFTVTSGRKTCKVSVHDN